MNAKGVSGLLLAICPISMMVLWIALYPALIGDSDTTEAGLKLALENQAAWMGLGMLSSVLFGGLFVGLALLSMQIRAAGGPGSTLTTVSLIMFIGCFAVFASSTGLTVGAFELAQEEGVKAAVPVQLISDQIGAGMPMFWGFGMFLLGLALASSKAVNEYIGWAMAVIGVVMVSSLMFDVSNSPVGMVLWIGMTLITTTVGVMTYLSRDAS
tara:strand:+ start:201 stop:836 length:636 start_codon:yes stop_codon:yes gene_type:complete